jgi:predicted PurR-regulated permease PerM
MGSQPQVTASKPRLNAIPDEKRRAPDAPPVKLLGFRGTDSVFWSQVANFATIGIFVVVAIVALKYGRSIVMPVVAALILAVTLRPIQTFGLRFRVPGWASALVIVAAFCGLVFLLLTLLSAAASAWLQGSSEIGEAVKQKLQLLDRPMAAFRDLQSALGGGNGKGPVVTLETGFATIARDALGILTPAASEFIVFFGTFVFFLVGTEKLRRQLVTIFETREARLRVLKIWNDIEHNLIAYVATVTVINLGLGTVTALMLWLIGFPSPLAFGALIFVLNYIPYVGPAIFATILAVVGFITAPTLGGAVLAPALFIAIATVEGHFLTPSIVGRRLTLSPFLVFLAVAFWTWLWGPLGTFLATPILIVTLVVLQHIFVEEETALPD